MFAVMFAPAELKRLHKVVLLGWMVLKVGRGGRRSRTVVGESRRAVPGRGGSEGVRWGCRRVAGSYLAVCCASGCGGTGRRRRIRADCDAIGLPGVPVGASAGWISTTEGDDGTVATHETACTPKPMLTAADMTPQQLLAVSYGFTVAPVMLRGNGNPWCCSEHRGVLSWYTEGAIMWRSTGDVWSTTNGDVAKAIVGLRCDGYPTHGRARS